MFRGFGTVLNVATVVAGAGIGLLLGHRLPQRTRDVVTDGLGLTTLLIAALSAAAVLDADLVRLVGTSGTVLVVLGALAIGGVSGSLLRIEAGLESLGATLQRRLAAPRRREGPGGAPRTDGADRRRFVEGFVTASLVFCVGPLTILGSLSDGLGLGYQQLALKAALDGFAAVAFAASFGWGVMASALVVGAVQGTLTVIGLLIGGVLDAGYVAALTAVGGLLLVGVALRLLRIKPLPVGDLLPALLVAPALVALVAAVRG